MATSLFDVFKQMAALGTEIHHPSIVSECTNRENLLRRQELELAKTAEALACDYNAAFFRLNANIPERPDKGIKSHVEIMNSNIINIDDLINLGRKVPTGKFILYRIISPCLESISIDAVVEDGEGNKAIRLSVYNATPNLKLYLQIGEIWAIKNPWCKANQDGGLTLREYHFPRIDRINDMTILTKLGNTEFVKKNYTGARYFYSEGLAKFPNDIDLLTNRSATFLHLRLFSLALSDAELLLSMQENHSKAIFQKTKALCGLGKYTEAKSFITKKINNAQEKKIKLENLGELEKLKNQVEKLVFQSKTGEFDIMELLQNRNVEYLEVAEYTSGVKVTGIEGKGRGLIATKEFSPGELIMANRALEMEFEKDITVKLYKTLITGYPSTDPFLSKVSQRLRDEPEQVENVYNRLYSGPNFERVVTRQGNIDEERLLAICFYNCFTSGKITRGLWILPSFFNHSCVDYNADWKIFGDMIFIRAVKPIAKHEEIVIPYTDFSNFEAKDLFFQIRSFRCTCKLCQAEKTVGQRVLKRADDIAREGLEHRTEKEVRRAIQELKEVTCNNKLLNMVHDNLYLKLVNLYEDLADFEGYSEISKKLYYDVESISFKLFILKRIYYLVQKGVVVPGFSLEKCKKELKNVLGIYVGPSNVSTLMKMSPDEFNEFTKTLLR